MNIIKPSVEMRAEPNLSSGLESECLFGESVEILEDYHDWVHCKLLTDNYCGWIKKEALSYMHQATHRIISKRSFIFSKKDLKSNCIQYLPLGSKLHLKNITPDWAEMALFNKIVYVPSKHLIDINQKVDDWVSIAELLIGTPYRWGGRDSMGIDCSALLQLAYETYGQNIPRNSQDQLTLNKILINDINNLSRGSVVFWKGHVGLMVDKKNCIHANAFHMTTVVEPLVNIIERSEKIKIIKMMDFN